MKLVNDLKWSTVGTLYRTCVQVGQIALLTRFLEKSEFGVIALGLFFIQFSQLFAEGGFTAGILHHKNISFKEKSSLFWLINVVSIVLCFILWISSSEISKFYQEPELRTIIPLLSLNLIFFTIGRIPRTLLQKAKNFKKIALVEIISQTVALLSAVTLVLNDFGIYSLVYPAIFNAFVSSFLFLMFGRDVFRLKFHFSLSETKRFFKIGVYNLGGAILDFFSREIDILIIGKFIGIIELGVYSLCKQIISRVYSIISIIVNSVITPHLVDHNESLKSLSSYYLRNIKLLAYGNFFIYTILVMASSEVLFLLYGAEYQSEATILIFIAVQYAIYSISNPVGGLQIATGKTFLGLKWTIIRVLTAPILIYLVAPYGIKALTFGLACLSLIYLVGMWKVQIVKMIEVSIVNYFKAFSAPLILFALATGGWLMSDFPMNQSWIISLLFIMAKGAVAAIMFTVLLRYFERPIFDRGISIIKSRMVSNVVT